ncbi:hypothetical protein LBMAG53_02160 [Planctomycetota bacterium]|nr:hypothetical protein LBMAG53_02160 [Planctomycetota bacterium]
MRSNFHHHFIGSPGSFRGGFSAIELVIAIGVILVLAGLLLVGIGPWFSQLAKRYDTQTRLGNLRGALEVYRTDAGTDALMTHALGNTRTWASLRKILETLRPAWATLPRDPRVLPTANQWDLIPPGIKLHYSPNLRTTGLWGDLSRYAVGDMGSNRIIHPVDDRLETWVYWLNRAPSSISGSGNPAKISSVVRDFVMPPVRASDGMVLFDVYGTTQRYTQLSGNNDFETFSGRVSPSPIGETLDNTFDIAPRYPLPVPPDGPAWYRTQWPPLKNVDDPIVGTPTAWPSTTSGAWDTPVDPNDAASIPIWEWPWGQPAIDRATTDLMSRTVGVKVQRRSLDHLSPERTFEILACASVVERTAAGRLAWQSDRKPSRPWNDAWGNPLVVPAALFIPPRYEILDGEESREIRGGRDFLMRRAGELYGHNRAAYIAPGAIGPVRAAATLLGIAAIDLPTGWETSTALPTWTDAQDHRVYRATWKQIGIVCQYTTWDEQWTATPPWKGVKQRTQQSMTCFLSAPIEFRNK